MKRGRTGVTCRSTEACGVLQANMVDERVSLVVPLAAEGATVKGLIAPTTSECFRSSVQIEGDGGVVHVKPMLREI